MLEVTISSVSITNVGFAIFLKPVNDEFVKAVPIFIGPLETYSISSALDGVTPPRPNTHDLIINMISEIGLTVTHVVINDIIGSIFYARIVLQGDDGVVELDARPSDSVAVAIRSKCPIYMDEKVYQEAAVIISEESEPSSSDSPSEDKGRAGQESEPQDAEPSGSEIDQLKQQLQKAVDTENFEEAAVLRDKINQLQNEN